MNLSGLVVALQSFSTREPYKKQLEEFSSFCVCVLCILLCTLYTFVYFVYVLCKFMYTISI